MEDIYAGVHKPGDILNEGTLVAKYQCSKSPVREALIALCENHVLRNIPRSGYEVTRLTMEDIREMLEFRYCLEGGTLLKRGGRITHHAPAAGRAGAAEPGMPAGRCDAPGTLDGQSGIPCGIDPCLWEPLYR